MIIGSSFFAANNRKSRPERRLRTIAFRSSFTSSSVNWVHKQGRLQLLD